MNNFSELLPEFLVAALAEQGITTPTEIQQRTVPVLIEKHNAVFSSETGTGKTLAYLLPVAATANFASKTIEAIVITPTRELAAQVFEQAKLIGLTTALVIGGANIIRQAEKLKEKPKIIVGTAGRVCELIQMKKLPAHTVNTLILDEADKLIDSVNIAQTAALIKKLQRDVCIIAASASAGEKTAQALETLTHKTFTKIFESKKSIPSTISHFVVLCEQREKFAAVRKFIFKNDIKKALVFVNNPYFINKITEKLNFHNLEAKAFSGDMSKNERRNAIAAFREGKTRFLVASDAVSRGLHINVPTVINLDFPSEPDSYLHRAGRCGRMGEKGTVVTFVTMLELPLLKKYEKTFNIDIKGF